VWLTVFIVVKRRWRTKRRKYITAKKSISFLAKGIKERNSVCTIQEAGNEDCLLHEIKAMMAESVADVN
jgi:hypothetical protein